MYVWVVEDNKVHKREVTVNAPTGEAQVLISKGLKPEEKIVIAGVYPVSYTHLDVYKRQQSAVISTW